MHLPDMKNKMGIPSVTRNEMQKTVMKLQIFLAGALILFGLTSHPMPAQAQPFSFAAIGDVPYGPSTQLARLISRINREDAAFTVHVGDIKSGSSLCSDETFLEVHALFQQFENPLIYTPGDNEWTDCHRFSNGSMDPLERLEKIRAIFFGSAMSLGKRALLLEVPTGKDAMYVENRRWVHDRVTFATLHIVGSNNNLQRDMKSAAEHFARDAANRRWMAETFARAKQRDDIAVVLAMQANTMFEKWPDERTGFNSWLEALESEAKAWGKPVLLIQGDTHDFRIDQPLSGTDKKRVENVTRLIVHGAQGANATLVDVRTDRPLQPFSFRVLPLQGFN